MIYQTSPAPAPAKKNRTLLWILLGAAIAIAFCVGSLILIINLFSSPDEPAPTAAPTQPESSLPASTSPVAGERIPYQAVVEIIALVEMDGELVEGWYGSGTIISPDGLILTNAHVVLSDRFYDVEKLVVALTLEPDQEPEARYFAEVMQADLALDIAVIRIVEDINGRPVDAGNLNLPVVILGDSDALQLGDPLTILGYPGIGGDTITLTRGEVSGFASEEGYGKRAFIKTSATIAGGNSGGLAANSRGEMVGIPTQVGSGTDSDVVDCRALADTNNDGLIDSQDSCIPTGGFINALRPVKLALPLIDAARKGDTQIIQGVQKGEAFVPKGEILFMEDFSDPNSGWDVDLWEEASLQYKDGEYQIYVKPERYFAWSTHYQVYDEVTFSVDTRIITPSGEGDYGVLCGYTDDKNFYGLEITEDGFFSIWKSVDGDFITILDWEYSNAIPQGEPATLTAYCGKGELTFGINQQLLASVRDDDLSGGRIGLTAGTYKTPEIMIGFDNLVIYEP